MENAIEYGIQNIVRKYNAYYDNIKHIYFFDLFDKSFLLIKYNILQIILGIKYMYKS